MSILLVLQKELRQKRGTPEKVRILSGFFKCGKGEYGEGDKFLGVTVPDQRKIAKKYFQQVSFEEVWEMLSSSYHEFRLTGLFLLVYRFQKANAEEREKIYRFYVSHTDRINNWDLVDATCPNIVGEFLWEHPEERKILKRWVVSNNIWERRMAVLATFAFIRKNSFEETLAFAEALLSDSHDLLHKAVGWMLREVGKRDEKALRHFLDRFVSRMPRTMLRYAIEKFSDGERKKYLSIPAFSQK